MGERTANVALLGVPFATEAGYTAPVVGDKVAISDSYEVAAAIADDIVIGEVFAINSASGNVEETVTVEVNGQKIDSVTASGNITAGGLVKIAGATSVAPWVNGVDDPEIIYGIALMDIADATVGDVLVK